MDKTRFMMLGNGERFYPFDPNPDVMDIEIIAHALSNMCRFSGQCKHFYSVAQHSVLCSLHVPEEDAFTALMHDATEAFIADIPKPLKVGLPQYEEAEEGVWRAVCERYGLPIDMPQSVKDVDRRAVMTEGDQLVGGFDWQECYPELQMLPITICPATPGVSREMFIRRYDELTDRS